jgi:hypothetical protein
MRTPDHRVRHRPAPVDEHAHLSPGGVREQGELAGEIVRHEAVGGKLATEQALELANLGGPEALGVSEDPDRFSLDGGVPMPRI